MKQKVILPSLVGLILGASFGEAHAMGGRSYRQSEQSYNVPSAAPASQTPPVPTTDSALRQACADLRREKGALEAERDQLAIDKAQLQADGDRLTALIDGLTQGAGIDFQGNIFQGGVTDPRDVGQAAARLGHDIKTRLDQGDRFFLAVKKSIAGEGTAADAISLHSTVEQAIEFLRFDDVRETTLHKALERAVRECRVDGASLKLAEYFAANDQEETDKDDKIREAQRGGLERGLLEAAIQKISADGDLQGVDLTSTVSPALELALWLLPAAPAPAPTPAT